MGDDRYDYSNGYQNQAGYQGQNEYQRNEMNNQNYYNRESNGQLYDQQDPYYGEYQQEMNYEDQYYDNNARPTIKEFIVEKASYLWIRFRTNRNAVMITVGLISVFLCCFGYLIMTRVLGNKDLVGKGYIVYNCFEEYSDGAYDLLDMKKDFGNILLSKGLDRTFVSKEALAFFMPKGCDGSEDSGGEFIYELKESMEYTLEYKVYFDGNGDDYSWGGGGVLCGLSGGNYYEGNTFANSGDGFSVLIKWNEHGCLYPVVYHKDQILPGGDIYDSMGRINDNSWHKIKVYVRASTNGQKNGVVRVWLDDTQAFYKNDFMLSINNSYIDKGVIQAYHKVNKDLMVEQDQYVRIDDYKVYIENNQSDIDIPVATVVSQSNDPLGEDETVTPDPTSTPIVLTDPPKTKEPSQTPLPTVAVEITAEPTKEPEATIVPTDAMPTTEKPTDNNSSSGSGMTIGFELTSEWDGGYSACYAITNNGKEAIKDWKFNVPKYQYEFTTMWAGTYTEDGDNYLITPADYIYTIEPGATVYIGFCANGNPPATFSCTIP